MSSIDDFLTYKPVSEVHLDFFKTSDLLLNYWFRKILNNPSNRKKFQIFPKELIKLITLFCLNLQLFNLCHPKHITFEYDKIKHVETINSTKLKYADIITSDIPLDKTFSFSLKILKKGGYIGIGIISNPKRYFQNEYAKLKCDLHYYGCKHNEYGYFYWSTGETAIHEFSQTITLLSSQLGQQFATRPYSVNDVIKIERIDGILAFYKNGRNIERILKNEIVQNVKYYPCININGGEKTWDYSFQVFFE